MIWMIMAGTGDYEGTKEERSSLTNVWNGDSWRDTAGPAVRYTSKKRAREDFCKILPPRGTNWMKIVPQSPPPSAR